MYKKIINLFIVVITIACFGQGIEAKNYHVTDGRELFLAFLEASSNGENDNIYLAAGVYKGEFIFETSEAKSLTLTTEQGLTADQVVFDGEKIVRPLYFYSEVVTDIAIINVSIINGISTYHGSGVYIKTNGNIVVHNSYISNNLSKSALYINNSGDGSVTLSDNYFINNTSSSNGGGVYAITNCDLFFQNNIVKGNSSFMGAGIQVGTSGNIFINNNIISDNKTTDAGGGIVASGGEIFISNNHITGNTSNRSGGGVFANSNGNIVFKNNSIMNNISTYPYSHICGGGIYANSRVDISFINNKVIGNSSISKSQSSAGAIYASAKGYIYFTNNNITGNSTSTYGGGIFVKESSNLVVMDNFICRNICSCKTNFYGGGVFIDVDVDDVSVVNNNISDNSSALYSKNTGDFVLSRNKVVQNELGCINSKHASMVIVDSNILKSSSKTGINITSSSKNAFTCTIRNNIIMNFNNSSDVGGGIYVENFEVVEIYQNLISKNKASTGAGLCLTPLKKLYMFSNTIVSNKAEIQGGGVYIKTSNIQYDLILNSNIFWDNTANSEGDDIFLIGFGGNPRILNNNTVNVKEIVGTFENAANNNSSDPLFYSPETGDYHLHPNSPCIDAGLSYTSSDLDGTPILNIRDMGVYEYNPKVSHPADTNTNFNIEENEYNTYNNAWRNNLKWTKHPINIPIEYNTRAGFIVENGGSYTNTGAMKPLCWTPEN